MKRRLGPALVMFVALPLFGWVVLIGLVKYALLFNVAGLAAGPCPDHGGCRDRLEMLCKAGETGHPDRCLRPAPYASELE